MSVPATRLWPPQAQALCGTQLAPVHRVIVYVLVLLVLVVLVSNGHSAGDAIALVVAAGAAAARTSSWLSGQQPAGSTGGA